MSKEAGLHLHPIPDARVMRLNRNPHAFHSVKDMLRVLTDLESQLAGVEREKWGLLVDTRAVVGRMEPEFEAAFRHWRKRISQGFQRIAVLVATEQGKAQAMAAAERDHTNTCVFTDEAEALEWVARKIC